MRYSVTEFLTIQMNLLHQVASVKLCFYLDQFSIRQQHLSCSLVPQSLLIQFRALPTIYVIIARVCVCVTGRRMGGMNRGREENVA